MKAAGLQTHIWNNNLKSIGLLAFYPMLIIGMSWAVAYMIGAFMMSSATATEAQGFANNALANYWLLIIAGISLWFLVSYLFHTKMVRRMAHSHPVTRKDEPELYNLTENLCIADGMKMPQLEIIETHARNAFASGIDEKSFTVTVTRGLLQSLAKDEVEGVIAHELTHIQNRDVRLLIITIIFTGMLGFAAQIAWSQFRYSLWVPRRRSGKDNGSGYLLLLGLLCVLWLGYIATLFTRFALSRRREYMADAGAIQMTKNPEAMMRALMRISGSDRIPKMPADINMMCVENSVPFMGLFATHPPMTQRIKALSDTTSTPIPDLPQLKPMSTKMNAPRVERDKAFKSPWVGRSNWATRQRFKKRRNKQESPWANLNR